MDDPLTFFCLAPSSDVTIEAVDDPAKHLRDVVASLSAGAEDPPSLAGTPDTVAYLRVRFHGLSFISQIRSLEDALKEKEKVLQNYEWDIDILNKEKQQLVNENQNLKSQIHKLDSAQKEATESEVKLRTLLSEKEDESRIIKAEKSKLEYDVEGYRRRIKTYNESENRYKDEKLNLETQVNELLAVQKDAANREKNSAQEISIRNSKSAKASSLREAQFSNLQHLIEYDHCYDYGEHRIARPLRRRPSMEIRELKARVQQLGAENYAPSELESEILKMILSQAQRTIRNLKTSIDEEKMKNDKSWFFTS